MKDRLRSFGLDPVPESIDEAIKVQNRLTSHIITEDRFDKISTVAGVDVSYKEGHAKASFVVLSYKQLSLIEYATAECFVDFPYIPGFLSFREIPPLIEAFKKIKTLPDIILCDGQGIAHPKKMGIATHLGILLDIPTIGVAKSKLVGTFKEPENRKGAWTPLIYRGEVVGAVLRTKKGVKPVFVSPGHKVSLYSAIEIVLKTTTKYKTPEPIRFAHHFTKER